MNLPHQVSQVTKERNMKKVLEIRRNTPLEIEMIKIIKIEELPENNRGTKEEDLHQGAIAKRIEDINQKMTIKDKKKDTLILNMIIEMRNKEKIKTNTQEIAAINLLLNKILRNLIISQKEVTILAQIQKTLEKSLPIEF